MYIWLLPRVLQSDSSCLVDFVQLLPTTRRDLIFSNTSTTYNNIATCSCAEFFQVLYFDVSEIDKYKYKRTVNYVYDGPVKKTKNNMQMKHNKIPLRS